MEIFSDWHFWVACSQLLLTLCVMGFQFFSHYKIVGNDLTHLAKDVSEITTKQEKQGETLQTISIDLAFLKGKEETTSKIIEVLQKNLNK